MMTRSPERRTFEIAWPGSKIRQTTVLLQAVWGAGLAPGPVDSGDPYLPQYVAQSATYVRRRLGLRRGGGGLARPLFIRLEMMIPARTGSSFFRIVELIPDICCA